MSDSAINVPSNNKFHEKPSLMSDGRQHKSWHTESEIDHNLKGTHKITSNWEYRRYLTQNADSVMKENLRMELMKNPRNPQTNAMLDGRSDDSNAPPYLYNNLEDNTMVMPKSFSSDLKNIYLTRTQLQAKMSAPHIYSTNDSVLS